ncbi:hypothetical protein D3C84_1139800 [compost metagenome]
MNEHSKELAALNLFALNIPRANDAAENRPVTVVLVKPRTRTPSSTMHLRFDSSQTRFQEVQPA